MGFFDRLNDFGDRELVKTVAMRIDVGLQQLEHETSTQMIAGLTYALREEVKNMQILANKLTYESKSCLMVKFKGSKISYFDFLSHISDISEQFINQGGYPLI